MEDIALGALGASPQRGPTAHEADPTAEAAAPSEVAPQRSPEEAERLVLELIAEHADSLLRIARRHSLCADDAQDAYQRALEIFMRHARPRSTRDRAADGCTRSSSTRRWRSTARGGGSSAARRSTSTRSRSARRRRPRTACSASSASRARPRRCSASSRRRSGRCG